MTDGVYRFFAFARERHNIYLSRQAGKSWPWSENEYFNTYKFTNVFRELDKTTDWFRRNVREKLDGTPEVFMATTLFRWFNRIEIGEVIFNQPDLLTKLTPWEHFIAKNGDTSAIKSALEITYPEGPYVTGAYMLRSTDGMKKLDGILFSVRAFYLRPWRELAESYITYPHIRSVQHLSEWIECSPGQGGFTAYEIACDLIYTEVLRGASDIMTWAHAGPGAKRGLHRVHGRSNPNAIPRRQHRINIREADSVREMQELLKLSQDPKHWPAEWQSWDMRTVEHTLCEFDKYERVRLGQGVPRNRYHPPK